MTLDFPEPMMAQGEVYSGGLKFGCMQQIAGVSWPMVPPTGWRYVVRTVKALLHGQGVICAPCAGLADDETPCVHPEPCGPVHMTIWTGRAAFPLTDDLLTTYSEFDQLRLIATTAKPRPHQPYAQREVAALKWVETEPAKRHEHMAEVVDHLKNSAVIPAADIRTFLWDGKREIPYAHNWARASADQGR